MNWILSSQSTSFGIQIFSFTGSIPLWFSLSASKVQDTLRCICPWGTWSWWGWTFRVRTRRRPKVFSKFLVGSGNISKRQKPIEVFLVLSVKNLKWCHVLLQSYHECEFETPLHRLPVHLVRQTRESHVPVELSGLRRLFGRLRRRGAVCGRGIPKLGINSWLHRSFSITVDTKRFVELVQ